MNKKSEKSVLFGEEKLFEAGEVVFELLDFFGVGGFLDGVDVFLADLFVYFLSVDGKFSWGINSEVDLISLDFQDFYLDIVANNNTLVRLPCQN